jgi:MoxR-like ATPase
VALFARGHVLLEGDVGIGKTTVLRAFSVPSAAASSASKARST